jgi:hypothetical protein
VVANVWGVFDTDGSGSIELKEFLELDGLGDTLLASIPSKF